jgi:glycosyltransferase involved in cell wall biosynthesis
MPKATAPRVSILLPAYNAAATLAACARSIMRQTEPDWQCVIVDDGSTDGTRAAAAALARSDARFTMRSIAHGGLVAALRAGVEHCTAPYVARMDADDVMHRQRLTEQADLLDRHPELAAVGCHVRLFPRRILRDGWRAYERWVNSIDSPWRVRREAFVESPIVHPTLMIRRDVLGAFPYRACAWPEDYDLILRLLVGGRNLGVVPRRLLCWRESPDRLSRRDPTCAPDRLTACKAAFLSAHFLARTDAYVLWGYGGTGRALHRALRRHGKRAAYIVEVDPGRVGNRIHGAPVISPDELARVPRQPVVVSVAGERPRRQIREFMSDAGFEEVRDFVCAA